MATIRRREVVEQGRHPALVALLRRAVAEAVRLPVRPEVALEVVAGRRRLATGQALAAVLGECLEGVVRGGAEGQRAGRA